MQIGDTLDGSGGSINLGPGAEVSSGASVGLIVCGAISGGCSGPEGDTLLGADDGGFFGAAVEDPDRESN